ncbi:hypothetical protein SAMN06272739_4059 [Blastococcus haudaquaticus]|uniref:Uncharacterized protein n=1 Tax=Blastococcus haudaquaticus TaxID=1938745 RepID=A0A286H7D2_9ACTN|nr:hypothetical protein SAMN06272739_4059 [Blastococcus haudaquaticus]
MCCDGCGNGASTTGAADHRGGELVRGKDGTRGRDGASDVRVVALSVTLQLSGGHRDARPGTGCGGAGRGGGTGQGAP